MGTLKDKLSLNGIQDSFFKDIDLNEIQLRQAKERRIKELKGQLRHIYSVLYNFNPPEESKDKLRPEFKKLMEELNSLGINAKEEVAKIIKKIEGKK